MSRVSILEGHASIWSDSSLVKIFCRVEEKLLGPGSDDKGPCDPWPVSMVSDRPSAGVDSDTCMVLILGAGRGNMFAPDTGGMFIPTL